MIAGDFRVIISASRHGLFSISPLSSNVRAVGGEDRATHQMRLSHGSDGAVSISATKSRFVSARLIALSAACLPKSADPAHRNMELSVAKSGNYWRNGHDLATNRGRL